jgi:thiamine pyrophosphate-dependent acetolactate synthase large subunit-like protein
MNGAESLLTTLLANKVDVCFANPGTSEMHFVAALDSVEGMRCEHNRQSSTSLAITRVTIGI